MNAHKRKALEAAGFQFTDAAEDVERTEEEKQLAYARVEMAIAVRRLREAQGMSQKALANRIKTSQPRIAKIEKAAADVSIDQLFRAYAAIGGRVTINSKAGKMRIDLQATAK